MLGDADRLARNRGRSRLTHFLRDETSCSLPLSRTRGATTRPATRRSTDAAPSTHPLAPAELQYRTTRTRSALFPPNKAPAPQIRRRYCCCCCFMTSRQAAAAAPNAQYLPQKNGPYLDEAVQTHREEQRRKHGGCESSGFRQVRVFPPSLLRIQTMAIFLLHRSAMLPLRARIPSAARVRSAALTAQRLHPRRRRCRQHRRGCVHRPNGPQLEPDPL